MIGLGTIINTVGIIIGGVFGLLFGKKLNESTRDTLCKTCGLSVVFFGISGTIVEMVKITGSQMETQRSLFVVICLVLGAAVGELLKIEDLFERFGEWLKEKTGNAKDKQFVNGFVTTSLTVCIGAMAVIGSIEDGINGDYSILTMKAILDLIIVMAMTASLGKGCIFSAIPVAACQGIMTVLAKVIEPILTEAAMINLSLIGSLLIFCVGANLFWGKTIKVANLLPALVFAVIASYIPINL